MMNSKKQGRDQILNNQTEVQSRSNDPGPIRVLLVDPDESLQTVYLDPLAQEGFELRTANSGLECVAQLRQREPDLLVLEPQLPWGGGDGVLAIMGEAPRLASVPVMVLTACHDPEVLNRVARFPVSDYQLKPLAPYRLAEKLRRLLHRARRRFTLAEQTGRLEGSIDKRTGGRVRKLRVETIGGRLIVSGRSDSHYVKQLALAAVREAFGDSESQTDRIEFDIEVE